MVKVKVIGAYVNGNGPGSLIDVDEKSAKYLERIGYGEITKEEPKATEKKPTKPKAKPKAKAKAKTDKE